MTFRDTWRWLAGAGLLLALFFVVQGSQLRVFERDYDEGVYLAQSHLVSQGFALYEPVDSALPPFLIWLLAALFRFLGGPSVLAARVAIVASGALGLLAIGWIAARLAPTGQRRLAALAALAALLALPRWLLYGQIAMADIPSLSFSLLSVALALEGWRRGRWWFFAGGVAAGIAMGFKFLAAYNAPLLALLVLLGYRPSRPFTLPRFLLDGLATLAGFALPLVAALPFLNWDVAYTTMIHFHWASGREWVDPPAALRLMATFHWEHLGWTLLALVGAALLARRGAWRVLLLLVGWELLVAVMLAQHAPLWGHLLLPLAMPVIVLAGLALAETVALATRPASKRIVWALPLLALAFFLALWPSALRADLASTAPIAHSDLLQQEIIPWLQSVVAPDAFVLTDSQMIAVRAERLVVPDKTDTSFTKIASGFLTADELIAAAERARPAAVIFWSGRFNGLPAWQQWVEANYTPAREGPDGQRIFLRPDLMAP